MKKQNWIFSFFFLFLLALVILPFYFFSSLDKKKRNDPKYNIEILIQTGPEKEQLKSMYLAELMELSLDQKTNIYNFDVKKAKEKLLKSPLIKKAKVKKYPPNAIYVDYKVKNPIAWLYDLKNVAIDDHATPFPISPFLSPKNMAEIYLGENLVSEEIPFFLAPIKNKKLDLALNVLKILKQIQPSSFVIKRIDVSKIFSQSYGKREIVVFLDHYLMIPFKERQISFVFPRIIRLCVKDYDVQLSNYFSLNTKMMADYQKQLKIDEKTASEVKFSPKVIDMRILKLAFIDE